MGGHSNRCWDDYSEAAFLHLGPRYSVSERRWTQMLAGAEDGGPGPSPRSFHAAAYVPAGHGAMYLLGGLTATGVTRDFWVLNLTTLQWRQEKVSLSPSQPPGSSKHGQSSSCQLSASFAPPRKRLPPWAPAQVPELSFCGHPGSHFIPRPIPGQEAGTLLARLGISPLWSRCR